MGTETLDQDRLLEIYKVHAELAERVAALRESTNRVYTSTAGGVLATSVLLYRLSVDPTDDSLPMAMAMALLLPLAGVMVSISWGVSVLSITKRLSAKGSVLRELERQLPFDFLGREKQVFMGTRQGRFVRRRNSLLVLPVLFLLLCVVWIVLLVQGVIPL